MIKWDKQNPVFAATAVRSSNIIGQVKNFKYLAYLFFKIKYSLFKIGLLFVVKTIVNQLDFLKLVLKLIRLKNSVIFILN